MSNIIAATWRVSWADGTKAKEGLDWPQAFDLREKLKAKGEDVRLDPFLGGRAWATSSAAA